MHFETIRVAGALIFWRMSWIIWNRCENEGAPPPNVDRGVIAGLIAGSTSFGNVGRSSRGPERCFHKFQVFCLTFHASYFTWECVFMSLQSTIYNFDVTKFVFFLVAPCVRYPWLRCDRGVYSGGDRGGGGGRGHPQCPPICPSLHTICFVSCMIFDSVYCVRNALVCQFLQCGKEILNLKCTRIVVASLHHQPLPANILSRSAWNPGPLGMSVEDTSFGGWCCGIETLPYFWHNALNIFWTPSIPPTPYLWVPGPRVRWEGPKSGYGGWGYPTPTPPPPFDHVARI